MSEFKFATQPEVEETAVVNGVRLYKIRGEKYRITRDVSAAGQPESVASGRRAAAGNNICRICM